MVVAVLNIWIPQHVGNVINILTKICQTKGEDSLKTVLLQLTEPAFALARMYVAQVCKCLSGKKYIFYIIYKII